MMTREQRAKQFLPFDAMKGLKEALLDREEQHSRVERHDITEEQKIKNSAVLATLKKYDEVKISYHAHFHDMERQGKVLEVNLPLRKIKVGEEEISVEDIYEITKIK